MKWFLAATWMLAGIFYTATDDWISLVLLVLFIACLTWLTHTFV